MFQLINCLLPKPFAELGSKCNLCFESSEATLENTVRKKVGLFRTVNDETNSECHLNDSLAVVLAEDTLLFAKLVCLDHTE